MQLVKLLLSISRAPVAAVFAAGLISGVANTYLLYLISRVLSPGPHAGVEGFAVTGSVALVAGVLSQLLMIRLTQDAIYRLRAQLSSGVVSAPLERLERLGAHRLLATLTEDVQSLSQAVSALPNFCVDVVTIVGCLVFLAVVSGPIFTVTVAGTAASILGVEMVLRRVRLLYREARESEDALLRSFQSVRTSSGSGRTARRSSPTSTCSRTTWASTIPASTTRSAATWRSYSLRTRSPCTTDGCRRLRCRRGSANGSRC